MKFIKIILTSMLFFLINIPSVYAASGGTGYVEIERIRVGGGFIRVTGTTAFTDPSGCGGADVIVTESTASYKEIVSILLSAKIASKPVQFWVSGCTTDSGTEYPRGLYVYLKD